MYHHHNFRCDQSYETNLVILASFNAVYIENYPLLKFLYTIYYDLYLKNKKDLKKIKTAFGNGKFYDLTKPETNEDYLIKGFLFQDLNINIIRDCFVDQLLNSTSNNIVKFEHTDDKHNQPTNENSLVDLGVELIKSLKYEILKVKICDCFLRELFIELNFLEYAFSINSEDIFLYNFKYDRMFILSRNKNKWIRYYGSINMNRIILLQNIQDLLNIFKYNNYMCPYLYKDDKYLIINL